MYLVIGGKLLNTSSTEFEDLSQIHFVGAFDSIGAAKDAWKAEAWRTVDNALMRYFIVSARL